MSPAPLLSSDQQSSLLEFILRGGSAQVACNELGLDLVAYMRTFEEDAAFRARLRSVRQLMTQNVLSAVYKSALNGIATSQSLWIRHFPPPTSPNPTPRTNPTMPSRTSPTNSSATRNRLTAWPNPPKNEPCRQSRIGALRSRKHSLRKASATNPHLFRNCLLLDPNSKQRFGHLIQPWQATDFEALDPAWITLARTPSRTSHPFQHLTLNPQLKRAWIERPRGHAKTGDVAIQIAWALLFAVRALRGIAAAADREQAQLIADAVRNLALANAGLCDALRFRRNTIENPESGARLDLISSDVASSYGLTPDFVICDELCHWPHEGLWHSLASAAAKTPHCLLAVLTNAGTGRGWQWQARETARTHPHWHFSTLDGPHAPWITAESLAEQRALLPASVYDRLWNNRWQDAAGDFLSNAEVAACRDEQLTEQQRGRTAMRYVAAIDYAEKHDLTAAIVLHRDTDRLVVDRLDVAVPTPDKPVLIGWVEDWIARAARSFPQITFVVDEHQLLGTLQRLSRRHRFVRFPFAAGHGNHELALTLRRLVVHQQIGWYPGCGARPDDARDDLETELASLVLRQSTSGRIRFDHPTGSHDDRAFVLAAAAWYATSKESGPTIWKVTPPGAGLLV